MQGIQIADPKAPWVMFERRDVEDRDASIAAGRYVTKDVDYALITPHGSKDQIERVVAEWFPMLEQQVREGRFDQNWYKSYRNAYNEWKEGKEIPLEGTPVLNWPVLSPSQVRMLQSHKIYTVEVLAHANEETIGRLGMGGRALKQLAIDFLASAEGPGKIASRMSMLEAANARLQATVNDQALKMQQMAALIPDADRPPQNEARDPSPRAAALAEILGDEDAPAARRL